MNVSIEQLQSCHQYFLLSHLILLTMSVFIVLIAFTLNAM